MDLNQQIIGDWKLSFLKNMGNKGVSPVIANENLGIEIVIPNEYLRTFGYCCAGCELGIIGYDSIGTDEEIILATIKIISEQLYRVEKQPNYNDIKSHLKAYKGKMRFSKIVPASKITLDSIKRTIEIMDDEFQNICKSSSNRKN